MALGQRYHLVNGTGRVNLYAGANGVTKFATNINSGAAFTAAAVQPAKSWWDDITNWTKYDIVMLSCEGNKLMMYKGPQALQNMETYLWMARPSAASSQSGGHDTRSPASTRSPRNAG